MGKDPRSPQNDKVPSDTAAPTRLRPEEILAQTLTAPLHPEATDGWSPTGRRLFLIALAAAGAVLVTLGLLLTGGLGPGPGQPKPLETTPDASSLAGRLLRPGTGEVAATPQTDAAVPQATPTTRAASVLPLAPPPNAAAATPTTVATHHDTTATTTPAPTTTLPCVTLGGNLRAAFPPFC
jgi:hypothetical protein